MDCTMNNFSIQRDNPLVVFPLTGDNVALGPPHREAYTMLQTPPRSMRVKQS